MAKDHRPAAQRFLDWIELIHVFYVSLLCVEAQLPVLGARVFAKRERHGLGHICLLSFQDLRVCRHSEFMTACMPAHYRHCCNTAFSPPWCAVHHAVERQARAGFISTCISSWIHLCYLVSLPDQAGNDSSQKLPVCTVVYASDLRNLNLSFLRCRLSSFGKCRWAICYGAPGGDG